MKDRNVRGKYGSTGSLGLLIKPPSYAEVGKDAPKPKKPKVVRVAICLVCHQSGGTLTGNSKDGYRHVSC